MGTHPIFESDFDCLTVFRNRMLVLRCSRMLAPRARLAAPGAAFYSSKNQIPESNQFWMRHQIKSKDGFHKHIDFERIVAGVALVSFVRCLAVPGNFFLDTICTATWIAHGFWGVEAMIGDYVPLIAPAVVAGILKKLWLVFLRGDVRCIRRAESSRRRAPRCR